MNLPREGSDRPGMDEEIDHLLELDVCSMQREQHCRYCRRTTARHCVNEAETLELDVEVRQTEANED